MGGTIDLSNLYDLVGTTTAGRSPILRFSLNSIPDAGSTGTATITTRIFDGTDATRSSGERMISATATVNWESDGINVTVTASPQSSTVELIGTGGVGIQRTFTNADSDILQFTAGGPEKPASFELKLTSYISQNLSNVGLNPAGFFEAGNYFLDVSFTGIDFRDAEDNTFTSVGAGFTLAEDPGSLSMLRTL